MRKKIVAGNWKMNKNWAEAKELLLGVNSFVSSRNPKCEVIVAPPATYLLNAAEIFQSNAEISAQNVSEFEPGAYTGEISTDILNSIGVKYSIIGHSERRSIFGETNEQIGKKVDKALAANISPILCCGEVLEERKANKHVDVVSEQLKAALKNVKKEQMKDVIIAYEPVWAIGTGETATPEQAQEMHAEIRALLRSLFDQETSEAVRILYGGSVKPSNADELFSQPDIDGGLVGGASLNIEDFSALITSGSNATK
ncbi:triose-phosphate isomerase [Ornithobacterium rhinotracheale]|uniref:Triosephosphate isomerase n=1 Tax=Ornithobacterium rhinotracheale (strain ATCC 51463 / DSM 15997 / CCUG 23171 / CIP 104009 / LMG 9086) TaxID=867902 RepID=I4A121_ORNRL|nr:triose-phosphate isomerase [Ornithobacterium rhinotracheale]AFL97655.1 triosephosphate isomerase [Ornithobacterium rhinotracheale DSM 15997]AIP98838.1 triosephosphate isomerase [Ornithobacterium rhinotracheale ORT-UMN 88]KGB66806.1 triosephosphate isomerase [Ornithobacterium rhinotracheale H06-030791]MCK0195045.1 triose-phosphate isomerase [Ornithobacterium rhinotracheale]MCK0200591.1 triose-phosphate isomerase [Ornithobacterium rhinotracheale]